ncbi:MAG: M28 family peptidase, partial [Solirubrobacteraceae bacterium]|nr:M28 family peptidase [Solirubrobacteraceae bacterium]
MASVLQYARGMLDLRIYRAAFVPAVLALVVAAFSLETRPRAITTALPPDAFDAPRAMRLLERLAERHPSRRPGSEGDMALAAEVQRTFEATDFEVTATDVRGETIDGERTLRTVVAERPGRLSGAIVLVAHRDAAGSPALAELSGTATLMEIARLLSGRTTRRTIVLVSTSGGSGGAAGAAHWADSVSGPVDAVLVLGDMAGTRQRRPQVVPWSNALGSAPQRLQRTVEQALRTESGPPGGSSTVMQALRLAFPLTVSEQGPIVEAGLPAVLVSASGELGPGPGDPVGAGRLEAMGRAVLRTLTALDEGPDVRPSGPQAVVLVRNQMLPEWAVRVLAAALLLPPLLAGIDGLARVRRRRERILPWVGWTVALGSPLLAAALVVLLLGLLGAVTAPAAPVPPGAVPVSGAPPRG